MTEAAAYTRRGFIGGAAPTTLDGDHNDSTTNLAGLDLSTWAGATANGPIGWTINRGEADEESGEATGISSNSLTGVTRGLFGTSAQAHTSGATLELTFNKKDFDEANYAVSKTVGAVDAANQILVSDGVNSLAKLAVGASSIVGRKASGDVVALTGAEALAITGALGLTGGTLTGDLIVPDEAYDATSWNGSLEVPTKNAVRDKIETLSGGSGSGTVKVARKSADETVTSSTTLQDDDHLFVALGANETWFFLCHIAPYTAANTAIKVAFTIPSGATIQWSAAGQQASTTNPAASTTNFTTAIASGGVNVYGDHLDARGGILIMGLVRTSSTTGNLQLQWAQNASSGSALTIYTDSVLAAFKQ